MSCGCFWLFFQCFVSRMLVLSVVFLRLFTHFYVFSAQAAPFSIHFYVFPIRNRISLVPLTLPEFSAALWNRIKYKKY